MTGLAGAGRRMAKKVLAARQGGMHLAPLAAEVASWPSTRGRTDRFR
jgi:hypothetical protein